MSNVLYSKEIPTFVTLPSEVTPLGLRKYSSLECPTCHKVHVDVGKWRWRLHSTHLCEYCGELFYVPNDSGDYSVGVQTWDKEAEEVSDKWSRRFMELCDVLASWSKDPSTKNGAVLVDRNRIILGTGYNGYPRGVVDRDYSEREYKYTRIVHSEANAILSSTVVLRNVEGVQLYTGMYPCQECAKLIIQSGVRRVVTRPPNERWEESASIAGEMFSESGVKVSLLVEPETYRHG